MTLRVCPDCKGWADKGARGGRCVDCRRIKERARGTSTARGYNSKHKALSVSARADAIGTTCHLCGEPMLKGQPLALDHTADRDGYRGVAHLTCNASEGARRGNAQR